MKGKILLVTGFAVGYVFGTRAGRGQYEKIKSSASNFWNSPRVQKQVGQAEGFVKDKAPEVAEFLTDGAKKVASQVSGKSTTSSATRKSASSKPSASN